MSDDVDQGGVGSLVFFNGNPVSDVFDAVFFEESNGVVAEAGEESGQFALVGDVDAHFKNAGIFEGVSGGAEAHGGGESCGKPTAAVDVRGGDVHGEGVVWREDKRVRRGAVPLKRDAPQVRGLLEFFIPSGDEFFLGFKKCVRGVKDFDGIDRVALFDGVDNILSFCHLAENGVFAVEVGSGDVGDEKLAPVGVGPRVGHRKDSGLVVLEALTDFVGKAVAGAAPA